MFDMAQSYSIGGTVWVSLKTAFMYELEGIRTRMAPAVELETLLIELEAESKYTFSSLLDEIDSDQTNYEI